MVNIVPTRNLWQHGVFISNKIWGSPVKIWGSLMNTWSWGFRGKSGGLWWIHGHEVSEENLGVSDEYMTMGSPWKIWASLMNTGSWGLRGKSGGLWWIHGHGVFEENLNVFNETLGVSTLQWTSGVSYKNLGCPMKSSASFKISGSQKVLEWLQTFKT